MSYPKILCLFLTCAALTASAAGIVVAKEDLSATGPVLDTSVSQKIAALAPAVRIGASFVEFRLQHSGEVTCVDSAAPGASAPLDSMCEVEFETAPKFLGKYPAMESLSIGVKAGVVVLVATTIAPMVHSSEFANLVSAVEKATGAPVYSKDYNRMFADQSRMRRGDPPEVLKRVPMLQLAPSETSGTLVMVGTFGSVLATEQVSSR